MQEILPCPFCGGAAFSERMFDDPHLELYEAGCEDDCAVFQYEKSEEEAVAKWNRRADDADRARLVARIEELDAEVDRWRDNCTSQSRNATEAWLDWDKRYKALESQLATLQAATQGVRYGHRNGETEPPTVSGRYWLKGEVPQGTKDDPWSYTFGEHEDIPYIIDAEENVIDLDGAGYTKPVTAFVGQYWGPVQMPVPPWETTPVAAGEGVGWEPLTDENSIDVRTSQNPNVGLWVYADGERISASTSQYEVFVDLPDDIRLCRKRPPAQG